MINGRSLHWYDSIDNKNKDLKGNIERQSVSFGSECQHHGNFELPIFESK